ncbi:MAG TPA: SDR family NAD(P)-dependent oxidoreductase [Pirellulaceae bacterium]|nr:SDR family NAD(P)-dependent oxidoreductase [Pirellulaceae bacterium]
MPEFWRGKHVIITGASSGIGSALALVVAARGANVGLIARRAEPLQELATKLQATGASVASQTADVTDSAGLTAAVHSLETTLGPCEVLIANAGVYRKTSGAAYDAARAEQVFRTNLIGVSNALGTVLPGMVSRKRGVVCAVSSLGGRLPLPAGGAYCASKAAIAMLMQSVRLDVEASGIQVTTVFPGFVDTTMITDHERRTLRGLFTAPQAAQRIAWAIERGRREYAFPWSLWLEITVASLLPWSVYRWVMKSVPPMEET